MATVSPFTEAQSYRALQMEEISGVRLAAAFRPAAEEYRAAREQAGLFDRSNRGLLIVTGADRAAWLHNLVTNAVTTLEENRGNYAFAVNLKGRILFDLNILCLPGMLWLDLDRAAVAMAATHFDRHLFRENVKIEDTSGQFARLGCCGPRAADVAGQLGLANLTSLPRLASRPLADGAHLVRHDFAGLPGFELVVPRGQAAAWWDQVAQVGARPTGHQILDLLRVEAGIPWLGRDLGNHVLPEETGQGSQTISHHKGPYLGQEVIERLRAREVLAKRLVRLQTTDGAGLDLPAALRRDGVDLGQITSLVKHPAKPYWLGLGYLKTAVTGYADITAGSPPRAITICSP